MMSMKTPDVSSSPAISMKARSADFSWNDGKNVSEAVLLWPILNICWFVISLPSKYSQSKSMTVCFFFFSTKPPFSSLILMILSIVLQFKALCPWSRELKRVLFPLPVAPMASITLLSMSLSNSLIFENKISRFSLMFAKVNFKDQSSSFVDLKWLKDNSETTESLLDLTMC